MGTPLYFSVTSSMGDNFNDFIVSQVKNGCMI